MNTVKDTVGMLKASFRRWWDSNTFLLGAGLAFYTIFSLAPVVVIAVTVAGLVFTREKAWGRMTDELSNLAGEKVAGAVETFAREGGTAASGAWATAVSVVVLLVGATTVFAQLQEAVNAIWGVKRADSGGLVQMLIDRFWSFTVVLGVGFLLLVSLVISAALAALATLLPDASGGVWWYVWQGVHLLISFGLVTLLFALIYKLLPDVELAWGDVWVGAAMTAGLFALGKYLIGLYLGQSAIVSAYGAAGSLIVILLWVYYSSQLVLFGAAFTREYANHTGKRLVTRHGAEAVTAESRAQQKGAPARPAGPPEPPADGGGATMYRVRQYWDAVRTSYWFLPAVMTVLAVALALVTIELDQGAQNEWYDELAWIYTRGPEGARAVLSTVAGSMITVAGVVFSITIVALSLASNQFGPRLLRNFMRDTGNQVVLGTFVATFVYCLLVLRTVRGIDDQEFVPHVSVSVAVLMALASLGVLIYFVHHVSMSIQAPQVVAVVAEELHGCIDQLFPEELGDGPPADEDDGPGLPPTFDRDAKPVIARDDGYVQAIDAARLMAAARSHDLVLRLVHRPGQFVVRGAPLAHAGTADRLDDAAADAIRDAFVLGSRQTPTQDVEFAVNQLVEIAVRALSPGINDPFTAMACVDRLTAGLSRLAVRKLPSAYRRDGDGELRVVAPPMAFADVLDAAFGPIRHYGAGSPMILTGLLTALETIAGRVRRSADRDAVGQQADLILSTACRELAEEADRRAVEGRYLAVRRAVGRTDAEPETRDGAHLLDRRGVCRPAAAQDGA